MAAWPALGDRPFTATHLDVEDYDRRRRARHLRATHGLTLSSIAYYDNNLHPDPAERAAVNEHVLRCIDAAADLGCPTVGTFVGRDPGRSVRENLADAEAVFAPLVDRAGERGVKLIIENCVMEGWHPDGYPGNLAYSPELWEWMFSLGLYLNYDPSHLMWIGIDPVAAVRPYLDRIPHAQAKDIELFPDRSRPLRVLRQGGRARRPVGRRLVALPGPGPRPGRLGAADRRHVRGRLRRRAVRRARGPRVGRHRGAGRGRPRGRAPHPAPAPRALIVRDDQSGAVISWRRFWTSAARAGSPPWACMAMSLVMSPSTLIWPVMKACMPACWLPSTNIARATE